MLSRSMLLKSLALLIALSVAHAPQALADGGGASPGGSAKPTGGTSIGGTTKAQRKAAKKHAEAKRKPVIVKFTLSNTTLAEGDRMKLRYRITAPARHVRVRAVVRTAAGKYVRTIELGLHRTRVAQKKSLSLRSLGVERAGAYKLRLTARDGKNRVARRAEKIPAWLSFSHVDHRFPLRGPFSFGGAGARFGVGRPGHTHQGQDIVAGAGTQIVAPYGGTISYVSYQVGGAGYYVVENADDGRDYVFMHLQKGSTAVKHGQRVATGDAIGLVGTTGASSGPHLHFEVWTGGPWQFGGHPIDPLPILKSWLASTPAS